MELRTDERVGGTVIDLQVIFVMCSSSLVDISFINSFAVL